MYPNSDFMFDDFMFGFFPVIFIVMFCLIAGIIIFTMIKGVTQWNNNNNSPVLTVNAKVVAKRINVSHSANTGPDDNIHSSSTWYYATFQVDSGDRMELLVPNVQYGMLVEGDIGSLTFQGTRYKTFVREVIL